MTKAVLDTNILVSAFIKYGGNEWKILQNAAEGKISILTTEDLLEEFHNVISRQKFQYNKKEIQEMMEFIITITKYTTPTQKINKIKEDPADNKILECATAGGADYIISGDQHLLKLREYKKIPILTSTEFLKKI